MKNFEENFFKEDNFIQSMVDYNYANSTAKNYHICYNVNDAFIYIMGASIISVLENNKGISFPFTFLRMGVVRKIWKNLKCWQNSINAGVLYMY